MNRYWPGTLPEPSVLTLDDMRCVLANPEQSGSTPLYFMYRDLALTRAERPVRHYRHSSGEYVRTKGHYHPQSPTGIGLPRVLPGARR